MTLTIDEKLKIANQGGLFEETNSHSWKGKKIKHNNELGTVTKDENGRCRVLTIKFGERTEKLTLNNVGPDLPKVHEFKFESRGKWYRF